MGGSAQAQIHAQLILRTARGEAPADAVTAPRFVVGGLEPGGRADLALAEPGCGEAADRRGRRRARTSTASVSSTRTPATRR